MMRQRIGLVSSAVPLIFGGGRFIVEWLEARLRADGHQVETILVPTTDDPDSILEQMTSFRLLELNAHFDTVITFRPPSHVVEHRRKVCWFIHHVRVFYDLWDTRYNALPDTGSARALRDSIHRFDTATLREAHKLFTNSRVVTDRVQRYNGLASEILYPPVQNPELFRCDSYRDEIICVSRMEDHKRQHLLIEAMQHVRTPVRLRLCGLSSSPAYLTRLTDMVANLGLEDKVIIEHRWITEQEKADRLARCLAAAYVPFDEDSYGYPTLEAAHASKATVTVADSGGVTEFVEPERNGYVTPPEPKALADVFDTLHADSDKCARLGNAAKETIGALGIDWRTTLDRLLS